MRHLCFAFALNMKWCRGILPNGLQGYAQEHADGTMTLLEGSPFDGFRPTAQSITLARRLSPLDPVAIFGIGLNYRDHAAESGKPLPEKPMVFMKPPSSVQHPGGPIVLPRVATSLQVDWEAELAVVIGKTCKNVSVAEANACLAGYTVANDVSARDWQFQWGGGQFCQAKGFDTFCPLGPSVVTPEEVDPVKGLYVRSSINGISKQEGTTRELIFTVAELVSFLSSSRTLYPGTVILTGTPAGVGFGRTPPEFLRAGDVVTVEVEGIGAITNPVVEEEA